MVWPEPQGYPADALGGDHPADLLLPWMEGMPKRGIISIPASWFHRDATRNTVIQEVFHTLDRNLGFGPAEPYNASHWYRGDTNVPLFDMTGLQEGRDYQVLARFQSSVKRLLKT